MGEVGDALPHQPFSSHTFAYLRTVYSLVRSGVDHQPYFLHKSRICTACSAETKV